MPCPANVTIINKDEVEHLCPGRYHGDGRITCTYKGRTLMVDPEWYYPKDARRLFIFGESKWSKWYVKSVVLDAKHLRKTGNITRSQKTK